MAGTNYQGWQWQVPTSAKALSWLGEVVRL